VGVTLKDGRKEVDAASIRNLGITSRAGMRERTRIHPIFLRCLRLMRRTSSAASSRFPFQVSSIFSCRGSSSGSSSSDAAIKCNVLESMAGVLEFLRSKRLRFVGGDSSNDESSSTKEGENETDRCLLEMPELLEEHDGRFDNIEVSDWFSLLVVHVFIVEAIDSKDAIDESVLYCISNDTRALKRGIGMFMCVWA